MTHDHSHPRRGEALWRLHKEGGAASCELRDGTAGEGWELVVRIDNEITGTRRYDSERIARVPRGRPASGLPARRMGRVIMRDCGQEMAIRRGTQDGRQVPVIVNVEMSFGIRPR